MSSSARDVGASSAAREASERRNDLSLAVSGFSAAGEMAVLVAKSVQMPHGRVRCQLEAGLEADRAGQVIVLY